MKVANTPIIGYCHFIANSLSKRQNQQLLMLCSHLFFEGSGNIDTSTFAYTGGQCLD
jgi:hypothetical protein